jgi:hypothetical protein
MPTDVDLQLTPLFPNATQNAALDLAYSTAQSNGSNTLYVPPGLWSIKGRVINTDITLVGVPGLSFLSYDNDTINGEAGLTIDYTGDATASFVPVSFTDGVSFPQTEYRDKTCAIVAPAGLIALCQEGDTLHAYSLTSQPFVYDLGGTKEYLGETFTIDRVDTGTNTIYTRGRPMLAALFAAEPITNLKIRRLSRKKFKLDGVGMKGATDNRLFQANNKRSPAFELRGVADFSIRNVEIYGAFYSGFRIMTCSRGRISNIRIDSLLNLPSNGGYGYGLDVYGSCSYISVDGCEIYRGRHGVTNNTLDDTIGLAQADSKFYWLGYPTNCVFKNFTVFTDDGNAIDTHQCGMGLVFEGWDIFHPQENSYAKTVSGSAFTTTSQSTIVGKGCQVRALGVTIRNVRQEGGSQALSLIVYDDDRNPLLTADPRSQIIIADNQFRLSPDNGKPHIALSKNWVTNYPRIIIKNNTFINGTMIIDGNTVQDFCELDFESNTFMTATTDATAHCFDLFAGKVSMSWNRFDMRYCGPGVRPLRLRGSAVVNLINNFVDWPENIIPTNNAIVRSEQAAASVSQTKSGGNTGTGTCVLDATTPILPGVLPGVYQVRFSSATVYTVTGPNGLTVGTGSNGTAFAQAIKFTTTAGGTAFIAGDGFDITVGTVTTAAKSGGNTGTGTIAMDATNPVLASVKPGIYLVRMTSATAFTVTGPDGLTVGSGTTGTAFATQVKFTVTAGGTAFIAGDGFDLSVTTGVFLSHYGNVSNRPNQITQLRSSSPQGVAIALSALT